MGEGKGTMGNRTFFVKAGSKVSRITWKDVFSEYRVKHSKQDLEYALLAGSSLDTATDATMLQKWQRPWIFYPLLKGGIALIVLIYVLLYGSFLLFGMSAVSLIQMAEIIPPLIPPLILLVFFWEMNIPRNLSIYEVLGIFLVGGLLSFTVTGFMFRMIDSGLPAGYAALREEPAKLAASVIFLAFLSRKKKIYGITGLAVGAAVGAGFGAFESVSYAIDSAVTIDSMVWNQLLRGVLALGGHTLYCAPYTAAIALHMKDGRMSGESFLNADFALAFLFSCAAHFCWNTAFFDSDVLEFAKMVAITAALWMFVLKILQKCLYQVTQAAAAAGGQLPVGGTAFGRAAYSTVKKQAAGKEAGQAAGTLRLRCVRGSLQGNVWDVPAGKTVTVGRSADCGVCFPDAAAGVSRHHCSVQYTEFGWTVKDLNSSYGTFLDRKTQVLPDTEIRLRSDNLIYIGGKENVLQVTIFQGDSR